VSITDITFKASDGSTAFRYYPKVGVFFANDGGSTGGVAHDTL
jgi:hypothetical protein